jgi:hypothetical protein
MTLYESNVLVEFVWIPAHTNLTGILIKGNEKADELTHDLNAIWSHEIENHFLSEAEMKIYLRKREINKVGLWPEDSHKISKQFKLDRYLQKNIDLTKLKREDLNTYIRFTTGHACVAQQMKYFVGDEPIVLTCRFCERINKLDSTAHFIEDCDFFDEWRKKIFWTE